MSSTQYILKNNLLADLSYFSESMQQDRTVRIVLNSVSYNHDKKHYIFDFWEDANPKHLRVLRIKSLTVFGFKDSRKVERKINRDELFDFIDELKQVSNKVYVPNKELALDFSTNWVKDKNVVITGEFRSLNDRLMSIEKRIFPVISLLGGNPQSKINNDTDVLVCLDKNTESNDYKFSIENRIPTANLLELMDLVELELGKNLSELVGSNFLIYV